MKGETKPRQRNQREAEASLGLRPVGKSLASPVFSHLSVCLSVWRQGLSMYLWLAWNSQIAPCFCILSGGLTGVYYHSLLSEEVLRLYTKNKTKEQNSPACQPQNGKGIPRNAHTNGHSQPSL